MSTLHPLRPPSGSYARYSLVPGSLTYKGGGPLTSLQSLNEQEHEYAQIISRRIITQRPDILVVAGSVPRDVQEFLAEMSKRYLRTPLTILSHVKLKFIQRLARMTGARIIPWVHLCDKVRCCMLAAWYIIAYSRMTPRMNSFERRMCWALANATA